MLDRLGVRRDPDIGAWNRRWSSAGQWPANIMIPIGRFDMPFVRHADGITFVHTLGWILCGIEGN